MKNSLLSRAMLFLLLLAIPSQGLLIAQAPAESAKQSRMKQLQETMHNFQKSTKSFLYCMATDECETERQKELANEISYWSKRVLFLLAVVGASWFVKKQIVETVAATRKQAEEFSKGQREALKETAKETAIGATKEAAKAAREQLNTVTVLGMKPFGTKTEDDALADLDRRRAELEKLEQDRQAAFTKLMADQRAKQVAEIRDKKILLQQQEKKLIEERNKIQQENENARILRANIAEDFANIAKQKKELQEKIDEAQGLGSYIKDQEGEKKTGWFWE